MSDQPMKAPWADLRDTARSVGVSMETIAIQKGRIWAWWADVQHIMEERDQLRIEVDHLRASTVPQPTVETGLSSAPVGTKEP